MNFPTIVIDEGDTNSQERRVKPSPKHQEPKKMREYSPSQQNNTKSTTTVSVSVMPN